MIAVAVFGAMMAMLVAAAVVAPFVEERKRARRLSGDDAADRLEYALEALRQLRFDYETGKLDDEDYAALRHEHAEAAIAARDALAPGSTADGQAHCDTCGSSLAPGVHFCTQCGSPAAPQPTPGPGASAE